MKATVWSKENCPFCDQAKALLEAKGFDIIERKIGVNATKEELLAEVPNARSVPQIFIYDKHIGGFDQLKQHLEETTSHYGDGAL